jgi:hypothetical protein
MNHTYLQSNLSIGESAIVPTTYLGVSSPAHFSPNFAYNCNIDGWPTHSTDIATKGFLAKFEHLPLISW